MKLFSASQLREADAFTIQHEPITAHDLMKRAATTCVNWLTERYTTDSEIKVVCGLGNNGGDGLMIARLLAEQNYKTEVFIIDYSQKHTSEFNANYEQLKSVSKNNLRISEINSSEQFIADFTPTKKHLVIDALFGSGLNKPIEGFIAEIIDYINETAPLVIAIDIPSGLYCDLLNAPGHKIIKADYTLTFQFPKLSFMFSETARYVGEFFVLDIGLHMDYINHTAVQNYYTTKNDVHKLLKKRTKFSHKGDFGHSLIIAGSYGKIGAAILAAKACLRAGTGLLTVHVPQCGYQIMQTAVPEAMADVDKHEEYIAGNISLEKYNAIAIGPGMGLQQQTVHAIKLLIQNSSLPLVFDADAINSIAENKTWLPFIPADSVFTPHVKEFERLTGKTATSLERLNIQREFSIKYSVYVVLKGAHTSISCPDGIIYFNSTGNPGMAKGGSGDVLTGIITALIAQHYTPKEACILGVYIHGLAGDLAAKHKSTEGMIANDIIEQLPNAFKFLNQSIG